MSRIALALLIALPCPAWAGVAFGTDLAAALAQAKAEKRPLMVHVFTTWCGSCKELDAEVFGSREAETALAGFVALKVDAEAGKGPEFVAKHHVVGYPTVLFLDSDGNEIDRVFGGLPRDAFLRTAAGYAAGRETLADDEKRFLNGRGADLELAFDLGYRHATRVHEAEALGYLGLLDQARRGLLQARGPQAVATAARLTALCAKLRLALGKYTYSRGRKDFAKARDTFLGLRRDFPASEAAKDALYELAKAQLGLEQDTKAREALDQYLAAHGGSSDAANAYAWLCFQSRFAPARGIEVAQQALAREPGDEGLWDTLSELYALQGDKVKALEANARARALKPEDPYLREQQGKFQAAP